MNECEDFRFLAVSVALNVVWQFLVGLKWFFYLFIYFWFTYQLLVAHILCIHARACAHMCVCVCVRARACLHAHIVLNDSVTSE